MKIFETEEPRSPRARGMRRRRGRLRGLAGSSASVVLLVSSVPAGEIRVPEGGSTALAVVNGDTISAAELDTLLIRTHRGMGREKRAGYDYPKLLDKLINDRLILQQARALGLHEDPSVTGPVGEEHERRVIRRYVRDTFQPPDSSTVSEAEVREYFEANYWKTHLRQISVRTLEEARRLREEVLGGASMDSLARSLSLDSRRPRGGLHNFKYWGDVEIPLRDASEELGLGELSQPFPYREAFAFVRLEDRAPADPADLPRFEQKIRGDLLRRKTEDAWRAFIDGLLEQAAVRTDPAVLEAVAQDSARVLQSDFLSGSSRRAIWIDTSDAVDERELRKAISRAAMITPARPFHELLQENVRRKTEELVLAEAARQAGYFERPEVVDAYRRDLEQALIEAYLDETVASRITFDREEFRRYHASHPDEFRGPDEVLLGTLVLESREQAWEAATRLAAGADFQYLRQLYAGDDPRAKETAKWVPPEIFSEEIRSHLASMQIGETTPPVETATGWVIFKLMDRRRGRVKSLEEADMQLRQIMFQKKFEELLDEHLGLLKARSEIRLFEGAIEEYFGTGS